MPARHHRAGIVPVACVKARSGPSPALSVSGRRADRCTWSRRFMAEPQCDHRTVDAAVKKLHGARVSQRMGTDAFLVQRGASSPSSRQVFAQEVVESVMAERTAALIGEDGVARLAAAFLQPRP